MKIEYKNETKELVNIRGKKLKPGESMISQVFIKVFDEEVKKGNLTVYIDGAKANFSTLVCKVVVKETPATEVVESAGGVSLPTETLVEHLEGVAEETAEVSAEAVPETVTEEAKAETETAPEAVETSVEMLESVEEQKAEEDKTNPDAEGKGKGKKEKNK